MNARFSVPLSPATPRRCVVCNRPLDWGAPLTPRKGLRASPAELYPLCRELSCRWVFDQVWDVPEAEFRRQLRWNAQRWQVWCAKRRAERQERDRLLKLRAEAEAREDAAVFAALGRRADPPALRLTVPSGHGASRPLSKRRRRAYADHLDQIIADAFRPEEPATPTVRVMIGAPPGPELAPVDSTLPGRLCGACGGGCCTWGADNAYLNRTTIRRVMAQRPDLDAQQIRALYLEHLAPRTVDQSCINHTRDGCSLPRSLRSDICNRYACPTLRILHGAIEADGSVRKAIVLRRRQSRWEQENPRFNNDIVGGAVLTETATIRLRPPKPDGWPVSLPSSAAEEGAAASAIAEEGGSRSALGR